MNLQNLISEISVSQERLGLVNSAKQSLLSHVFRYADEGTIPRIKETRLIGSIKRKTKINPLDDVDILLLMGIGYHNGNNYHIIDDYNYAWQDEDIDENNNISSIHILDKLRDRLLETYPNSEIKRNNEVVNVYLKSYDIGFDLVPAFYYRNVDYYLIPIGSRSTYWKKTNPAIDEIILDEINANNSNKIKDVIKIAKHFFSYKRVKRIRSYHLESCAYHIFKDITGDYDLRAYVHFFYQKLNENILTSCPDPTGLSGDLSSALDSSDIRKIMQILYEAANLLVTSEEAYCEFVGFNY